MFTETYNLRSHKVEKNHPNIFPFLHYYFMLPLEKRPLIYTTWHFDALGFVSVTHCSTQQSTLKKILSDVI